MKRRIASLLAAGIFTSLLLVSCGGSTKGNWSEEDKAKFRTELLSVPELANLGEHKDAWIECCLNKCEANYSSFADCDKDKNGSEKMALQCNDEIFSNGSVKGNWSEKDKEKFRSDLNAVDELSNFGDDKAVWIECYLSKCEAKYPSYYHANQDEAGCEEIAVACADGVIE